jgi:penicillin-binding protein 2
MLVFDQLRKNDPPLRALAWGIAAGLLILLAGLYYVQVVSANRFRAEQENQSFRSVRLPALRGKITDRNGTVLAENRPSYHVSLYLEDRAVRARFKARFEAARANRRLSREQRFQLERLCRYEVVSNIIAQVSLVVQQPITLSEAQFNRHYERSLALPLPIVANLTEAQIARFAESSAIPPGVDLEVRPTRYYPAQGAAAHVLGYLRRDEGADDEEDVAFNYRLPDYTGAAGIESALNEVLQGQAGAKLVQVNNLGYRQSETILTSVEAGRSVRLTLDLPVQQAAERALSGAANQARGAVVVLDVRNGDVLALASAPSFCPGDWVPFMRVDVWTNLTNEIMRPLVNRAVHASYAPGSIFKIVTGLAALEAGWNPTNIITSPGYATVGRDTIGDTAAAGDYDFRRALKLSCNKYFVDAGLWVGLDRLVAMARRFGFGETTDLELRHEYRGLLPTREWISANRGRWRDGDTAHLAIGQGDVLVTPLQVAVMVAAVANGGSVFHPRLVDRIQAQDPFDPRPVRTYPSGQVRSHLNVSPASLTTLREAMLADVEDGDGSGRGARLADFHIAAKTGTAEVKKGHYVIDKRTWFVSFGPYENPRYAVVMMLESGTWGRVLAGPDKQVYQALIKREKDGFLATQSLARN